MLRFALIFCLGLAIHGQLVFDRRSPDPAQVAKLLQLMSSLKVIFSREFTSVANFSKLGTRLDRMPNAFGCHSRDGRLQTLMTTTTHQWSPCDLHLKVQRAFLSLYASLTSIFSWRRQAWGFTFQLEAQSSGVAQRFRKNLETVLPNCSNKIVSNKWLKFVALWNNQLIGI